MTDANHAYGDLAPEDAPQDEFWLHWRRCKECWPLDWMWFGYDDGACEIGKRLRDEAVAKRRPALNEV